MSSLFAKVIRQTWKTFENTDSHTFQTNFTALKQLVDQLTMKDINLDEELISKKAAASQNLAPCTFVGICENDLFAMSVFILKEAYTMPLHDHPHMYGLLKPLAGRLKVESYTNVKADFPVKNPNCLNVRAEAPKLLAAYDGSALLTPHEANFHEITAEDGPAAFFDILSPPYHADIPIYGPRTCSFFMRVNQSESNQFKLERIPTPDHFFCDSAFCNLPDFILDELSPHPSKLNAF